MKKELDGLKSELLEDKSAASLSKEKYDAESKRLKELRVQYKAANAVRQEAYAHFKELNDKVCCQILHGIFYFHITELCILHLWGAVLVELYLLVSSLNIVTALKLKGKWKVEDGNLTG